MRVEAGKALLAANPRGLKQSAELIGSFDEAWSSAAHFNLPVAIRIEGNGGKCRMFWLRTITARAFVAVRADAHAGE